MKCIAVFSVLFAVASSVAFADSGLRGLVAKGSSITDCGSKDVKFSTMTITPDPPVKGKPVALNTTGSVVNTVTNGTFSLTASLDGGQVFSHKGGLCGTSTFELPLNLGKITVYGLTCPATQGSSVNFDLSVVLPTIAPAGNYEVKIDAKDTDKNDALCIDSKFTLA